MGNDLRLVRRTFALLRANELDVWLAGGWAEQLRGMIGPRAHHDIDFLYRGLDFAAIDRFMVEASVEEIALKRLPHKRAFLLDDVMIEMILVRPGPVTDFWDVHRYAWPADTFADLSQELRLVSTAALVDYRAHGHPLSQQSCRSLPLLSDRSD